MTARDCCRGVVDRPYDAGAAEVSMRRGAIPAAVVLSMLLVLAAVPWCAATAQEFNGFLGNMYDTHSTESSYSWKIEYTQGINEHLMFSWSWLNEGHVTDHHRDGHTLQLWGRTSLFTSRVSVALGAGPYRYFDTAPGVEGTYKDNHGWAGILSGRLSYYPFGHFVLIALVNRIWASSTTPSTWTTMLGMGYQLQAPPKPGPDPEPERQVNPTVHNEISAFLGRTVVNSFESERSVALALEYRRGFGHYYAWSVSYINEGDPQVIRRNGLAGQVWAERSWFSDQLSLGVGAGLYFAVDQKFPSDSVNPGKGTVAGLVTPTVSWRFSKLIGLRFNWERTVSTYDRDTDIFLLGLITRW